MKNIRKSDRFRVLVTFDPVPESSIIFLKAYIKESLESSGGCRHPDDPLFNSLSNVKITVLP